jgi:RNA polymerase sigma-70 factor, ECF subfamily
MRCAMNPSGFPHASSSSARSALASSGLWASWAWPLLRAQTAALAQPLGFSWDWCAQTSEDAGRSTLSLPSPAARFRQRAASALEATDVLFHNLPLSSLFYFQLASELRSWNSGMLQGAVCRRRGCGAVRAPAQMPQMHDMREPDDGTLTALAVKAAAGDWQAFEELARSLSKDTYVIAYSILHDREAAEESSTDAWLKIGRSIEKFDPSVAAFRCWFYRIVVNAAKDKRRRDKGVEDSLSLDAPIGEGQSATLLEHLEDAGVLRQREVSSAAERVDSLLAKLDPRLRLVLTLLHLEGQAKKQVAEVLDVTPQRVSQLEKMARQKVIDFAAEEEQDENH